MPYNKITISGRICTGKSTLFEGLEARLTWPTIHSGQIFRDYVKKNKLQLEKAEEQNELLTKKVDYQVRDMLKDPKGNLLVDAWMAGIMADNFPYVLKILLVCQDKIRYQRFAKREHIILNEAKAKVEERQKSWVDKMQKIYKRVDIFDPKNYNLVIDTSYITPQAILKKVLNVLYS